MAPSEEREARALGDRACPDEVLEHGLAETLGEQLLGYRGQGHERAVECWRKGTVMRSWLIDLLAEAFAADPGLRKPSTHIEDTGEVNWLVADALRMEAPVPVIAQSVMQLFGSRDEKKHWARAIIAMRHGFGGHPYGHADSLEQERRESRVGEIFRPEKEAA